METSINNFTEQQVKDTDCAIELYEHIHEQMKDSHMLVGSQWVILELFYMPWRKELGLEGKDRVAKILGYSKDNKFMSAPIDEFRERSYCGIPYFMSDHCRKPDVIAEMKKLSEKHGNELCFYNPYQNKVIFAK